MRTTKLVQIVACHCEGEVGDVIVGGVAPPPGETLWAQSRFIASDQTLRNFVLREPRGGVYRHVNLLVPPKNPAAQAAWIIMEPEDTPPMSGSNSICVATVLLDTGIVPMQEPLTRMTIEAPGGLIEVEATCRAGKAERIKVTNVPSFVDRLDAAVEVEGLGTLKVDIAYGGDSFVIVDAKAARIFDRARRGARSGRDGRAHHARRQSADRLSPSRSTRTGRISRSASSPTRSSTSKASRQAATPSSSSRASSTVRPPEPVVRRGWPCFTRGGC